MPTSTSLHLAQNLCISLLDFFLKKVCILVAAVFLTLPMGALLRRCLAGEEEREFPLFLCLGRKEGEGERQASKKRRPLRHNRIWRKTSWVKYETFTLRGMVSANCQAHFFCCDTERLKKEHSEISSMGHLICSTVNQTSQIWAFFAFFP